MAKKRNWDSLSPSYQARLKRGGLTKTSYNRGADLSAARGHAKPGASKNATISRALTTKGKNLKTLKGNKFRDISIPIHYKKGVYDRERMVADWEAVIAGLKENPNVFASNTLLYYEHNDIVQAYPLTSASKNPTSDELLHGAPFASSTSMGFDKIVDKYLVKLIGDLKLINLTVHVIFSSKYLKSKK